MPLNAELGQDRIRHPRRQLCLQLQQKQRQLRRLVQQKQQHPNLLPLQLQHQQQQQIKPQQLLKHL